MCRRLSIEQADRHGSAPADAALDAPERQGVLGVHTPTLATIARSSTGLLGCLCSVYTAPTIRFHNS